MSFADQLDAFAEQLDAFAYQLDTFAYQTFFVNNKIVHKNYHTSNRFQTSLVYKPKSHDKAAALVVFR
jgi:hypothetical protein